MTGIPKDTIREMAVRTLTTGLDISTTRSEEYPFESRLLGLLGDPADARVLGVTDLLTNEILVLRPRGRLPEYWEDLVLANEFNHSDVLVLSPQRTLFFSPLGHRKQLLKVFEIDYWKRFLEAIALFENMYFSKLPDEFRTQVMELLNRNERFAPQTHNNSSLATIQNKMRARSTGRTAYTFTPYS
jgi:hypothetical protein